MYRARVPHECRSQPAPGSAPLELGKRREYVQQEPQKAGLLSSVSMF
jgi:hypothetical protein